MKAFMSDVDGGPAWLDQDRLGPMSCFGLRAEEFAAQWAMGEANMILAESEPGTRANEWLRGLSAYWNLHTCCGLEEMQGDCYTCYAAALAEALRAFVEAPC